MDGSNPPLDETGFAVALLLVCAGLVLAGIVAWLCIREAGKSVRRHLDRRIAGQDGRRVDGS